ncbi:transcriptional regulator with XRE-family HTH domain [Conyzicola lurida]|uniref:Transcriptional regulator with XRE-family HTH domain n=1 Tax=Conyzicola lurida TaxID=1172621 RepID=A0A841ARV0_9MICO|nr:helix-turn-helix transcriptional regulator [Conyzicola lurida]MBB5844672.1 transcriptional regulator with XRE-family HTH domain [Conyzicola lurida]
MDSNTEMKDFLATRRGRVQPEDVGLPAGRNRRVPGLRREELAALAGVSASWYTRLERGDATGVSAEVLDAISRTLKLDDVERAHLFDLAQLTQGGIRRQQRRRVTAPRVRPVLQQILDQMTDLPAAVQNECHDIVAVNALGRALYADMYEAGHDTVNFARYIHLDPRAKLFYPEWDDVAAMSAAMLRVAAARGPYNRDLSDLIGELATRSEHFRVLWASHDVHEHRTGLKKIHHPVVGDIDLSYEAMSFPGEPGLSLMVYTAEPGSPSADALRLLSAWTAPAAGGQAVESRGL